MKTAGRLVSGIAFALVAAACGDDTVEPEDVLTEEEAIALFDSREQLAALLGDSTKLISSSGNSNVYRCPQGGQVTIVVTEFSVDTTAVDTARIVFAAETTPSGCKASAGNREFTLDGDPSIRERAEVELVGFSPAGVTGWSRGGLKWTLEERSGSCEMDLAFTAEPVASDPDDPKVVSTYSGSLCGHEVEFTKTEDIVVTDG